MADGTLVVFYSRDGATLRAATHIASALDADLDRIEECGSRVGLAGYVRSGLEALAKGLPGVRTQRDPGDYKLVVIGGPVWVGTMASPVRSYLHAHAGRLRHAAFFAVMGGRGGEDTVREMQMACGADAGPTCVMTRREVDRSFVGSRCDEFIARLKKIVGAELNESVVRAISGGRAT